MKIVYDFRQNLNTGYDGQIYMAIPKDDSELYVIGTWSGVLTSSSHNCILVELDAASIGNYLD